MGSQNKQKLVLMITPALVGGSFTALKQLAEAGSKNFNFLIAGLGNYRNDNKNFKVIYIPYFRYDSWGGHLASKYALFGYIYEIPLYFLSVFLIIFLRPKIVIFNGLATLIPLLPIAKLSGSHIVLSFRSWFDEGRYGRLKSILQLYGRFVDLSFVNSEGTKDNLTRIFPKNKIIVVEHHAHRVFFIKRDREILRQKWNVDEMFVVLFVGRIDEEKHCHLLINLIKRLQNEKDILFIFVGEGRYKKEILALQRKLTTVRYLGFCTNISQLSEIYTMADVLWSYADETYLARPAVEALACGTPVIIPSTPAMGEKIAEDVHIDRSLLPKDLGWIVNFDKFPSIVDLIFKIKRDKLAWQKRKKCIKYAKLHYFNDPNKLFIKKISKMIN